MARRRLVGVPGCAALAVNPIGVDDPDVELAAAEVSPILGCRTAVRSPPVGCLPVPIAHGPGELREAPAGQSPSKKPRTGYE